ncbi:MAG: PaaX family transcriptional regulator C-terminal domain-containing protein [Patescibacteria group bacterium]
MAKRLRVRDKILLGAAILGDLYFEIAEPLSAQLGKIKGVLPSDYKSTNFAVAVSRMLRTGSIEKVIKNGEPYLRLTGVGKKALVRDFPIFAFKRKKWNGFWRMVFYDIPEKDKKTRTWLQLKLKSLGFGALQESVYISPFDVAEDVREFILAQNLGDFVFVAVSKRLFAGNEKALAEKVWNLEKLNEEYLNLYEKIKEGRSTSEIFSEYEEILRLDPCLPAELLPDNWLGDKVYKEIRRLIISS